MDLRLRAGSGKTPINGWQNLIHSKMSADDLVAGLKQIYQLSNPSMAELVLESYCPNSCKHCIYPTDYHHFNKTLGKEKWANILEALYRVAGLRKYVFSGRSLNKQGINIIRSFKTEFPDVEFGIICDGRTAGPLVDGIIQLAPDWVDVSVDGLEKEHDLQRNESGAYQKTIRFLKSLRESSVIKKVNILTCLTTLNMSSIHDMVGLLNNMGFKNFFLTPVTILEEHRPDDTLRPQTEDFINFINALISVMGNYNDTWLELDIYEARYIRDIKQFRPEWFTGLVPENDHLEYVTETNNNEFHLVYYPFSLTGLREFIVNSDGVVASPKAMAMGKIPKDCIFGNVSNLDEIRDVLDNFTDKRAFSFYSDELLHEKSLLGE